MPGRRPPVPQRDWDDAHLITAAVDAHRDDPAFGYRFIADEIRETGLQASERRIWWLCSQQGLWSLHSKKCGPNCKAGPPVHDDLVRRAFAAPDIDKLGLADITEHRTPQGKLYLCAIKHVCSNRIVGYSIHSRMKASLAVDALRMAVQRRDPVGTVIHSDRGSKAIVTWIERTYHRRRRQRGLGRLTPIEFETILGTQAAEAA